ncbi:MAG: O-antigen ligase family protein [Terracidiphilus sp.]
MNQFTKRVRNDRYAGAGAPSAGRLPFLKFILRYPIFLLAFGPPILRTQAIDATGGVIDFWSFLQVGWLSFIAIRAIWRLASAQSIFIPKQIRSVLQYAFFLGLLFLASAAYSPSPFVSAAYSILYLLSLICVVEFIVDVYRDPPNWMECLFQLRRIALFLVGLVFLILPFNPQSVMWFVPGVGIRLIGGTVAPLPIIFPVIAIISAYTFLHSLESRGRAFLYILVGLAGTLAGQGRGPDIALFIGLLLVAMGWAGTNRRSAYVVISGFMASILLSGIVVWAIGGGRIWNTFNRGQSAETIASASGRTEVWKFVISYCTTHPWGMGYVAGFRIVFRQYFSLGSGQSLSNLGGAHNAFIQFLADAGWLALALYLIMMAKVVVLGWRFAKKRASVPFMLDSVNRHAIRCALVLLLFCFVIDMDSSESAVPLRIFFYFHNVIVAIILGVSARMLFVYRTRYAPSAE